MLLGMRQNDNLGHGAIEVYKAGSLMSWDVGQNQCRKILRSTERTTCGRSDRGAEGME